MADTTLLEIDHLKAGYATKAGFVRAVDDVSLSLRRGEFLGIAGESGCGKSTLAYAIMRLLRDSARIESGRILLEGTDLAGLDEADMNGYRWTKLSMVFQSAMNALNPVLSIEEQLVDAVLAHRSIPRAAARDLAMEMLELVDINADRFSSFPHQLSGGMRQRIMIAMALLLRPDLLIMDEPTTALDVVVQRSILQKIQELRQRLGFSVIFITHDLSLLVEISDSLAIMYAGKVCEYGPSRELYGAPAHPYTKGLMNSFPSLTGPLGRMSGIEGQAPGLIDPPPGCRFAPRCALAEPRCLSGDPVLAELSPGRACACVRCGGSL
ncbi:ABC transporter ATP-binding protein [bacterium]|nr:ABC transporter ATP-binding protein [bacterium]